MPVARELRLKILVSVRPSLSASILGCSQTPPSKPAPTSAPSAGSAGNADEPGSEIIATSPTAKRECVTFVDTINAVLVEIERLTKRRDASDDGKRDLEQLSALYEKLHQRVTRLELEAKELRAFASEYLRMIRKVQKSLKVVVEALDREDVARAEKAQVDFLEIVALEDDLVDRINAFCEPRGKTA
jgi:hypothetical protein